MKKKVNLKGQGLSLNTIIIAALVLIVLVVLVVIFSGRMGDFTSNIKDCETKGGKLHSSGTLDGHACYKMDGGDDTKPYCCIPITDE